MRNHGIYKLEVPASRYEGQQTMYIDLGKIVSVSTAQFIDRMGCGGYFAEAKISVQLADPIKLSLEQSWEFAKNDKGENTHPVPTRNANGELTQVAKLQAVLDTLIKAWEEYNLQ